jgi:hypothetical protein
MEGTISLAAVIALMEAKDDDPKKIKELENKLHESIKITDKNRE